MLTYSDRKFMNNEEYYYHTVKLVKNYIVVLKQEFIKVFGHISLDDKDVFNARVINCFKASDKFNTIKDIMNAEPREILRLHGFGNKCRYDLEQAMNRLAEFEILKF